MVTSAPVGRTKIGQTCGIKGRVEPRHCHSFWVKPENVILIPYEICNSNLSWNLELMQLILKLQI